MLGTSDSESDQESIDSEEQKLEDFHHLKIQTNAPRAKYSNYEYNEEDTPPACSPSFTAHKYAPCRVNVYPPELNYKKGVGHNEYSIECEPAFDAVNSVSRRYSDFRWLRRILRRHFPCAFIPPVPAKKMFGRTEDNFVEERRIDLERFLNRLQGMPHLRNTNLVFYFLTSPNATWQKAMSTLEKEHTRPDLEICATLQSSYPHLLQQELQHKSYERVVVRARDIWKRMKKKLEPVAETTLKLETTYERLARRFGRLEAAIRELDKVEPTIPNFRNIEEPSNKQFEKWSLFHEQQSNRFKQSYTRSVRHLYQDLSAAIQQIDDLEKRRKKYKKTRVRANSWRLYNLTKLSETQRLSKKVTIQKENARECLVELCTKIIMHDILNIWSISRYREEFGQYTNQVFHLVEELQSNLKSLEEHSRKLASETDI